MRISTRSYQAAGVNSMLDQQVKLSKTQNQLSTGKRILVPSDDPVATSQLMQLRQTENTVKQYQANADAATNRLSTEEGVLNGVTNLLQRVRELAIQGNNATQTNETRGFIAAEASERLDELLGLANTKDGNGEYLFAGSQGFTEPFVPNATGGFDYMGNDTARKIQIGAGRQVADGHPGSEVFFNVRNGNGTFVTDATGNTTLVADTTNTGTGVVQGVNVAAQYNPALDGYQIVFDPLVPGDYEVFDASGTSLVPPVTGNYTDPGSIDIIVDGNTAATVALSGMPATDDVFTLNIGSNSGTAIIDGGSVQGTFQDEIFEDASGNLVNGYTLKFTQSDPADPITYEVFTSGDLTPVATGTYVSGEPIAFQGALVTLTGTPADGDTFAVRSSEYQDIFQTLQNFITALETPVTNSAQQARLNNEIGRFLGDVDQAMNNILGVRASAGARLNAIDGQRYINDDQLLQTTQVISSIEDLDYAEATSRLNMEMAGLEAAQQTYIKVQGLSLFNYL